MTDKRDEVLEEEVVRCTSMYPSAGALREGCDHPGLRCRFSLGGKNVEVPAEVEGGGIIACKAPKKSEFGECDGPAVVEVYDGDVLVLTDEYLFRKPLLADEKPTLSSSPSTGRDFGARKGESTRDYLKREYSALKPFVIISSSYLLFTITDGAVRMIVLLHAYTKGFDSFQVAIMFSLYELAGVVTNLLAGVMGARWGIKSTLISGLTMQLAGLGMLFGWQDGWNQAQAIIYVTAAQTLCGIAKDLTKLGGKTVTKLVTPDEKHGRLFKLVSFITGFKNSLKGAGYFLGAALVSISYYLALGVLCGLILLALPWALIGLSADLGKTSSKGIKLSDIFSKNQRLNYLSLARFFLFGSRDLWFEVPLPFFLRQWVGLSRSVVGAFLAVWIIVYGQVQSWSPQLILKPLHQTPPNKMTAALWAIINTSCPIFLGFFLQFSPIFDTAAVDKGAMLAVISVGLVAFAIIFAVNSSVHSYLVVRYSEGNKLATNVGFYYMSNAAGRLVGTLVSGAMYTYVGSTVVYGFASCFWLSLASLVIATVITLFIKDDSKGISCGPCLHCLDPVVEAEDTGEEVIEMA